MAGSDEPPGEGGGSSVLLLLILVVLIGAFAAWAWLRHPPGSSSPSQTGHPAALPSSGVQNTQ